MTVHLVLAHHLRLVAHLEMVNSDVVHIQMLIVVLMMLIVVQMGTHVMLPKVNALRKLQVRVLITLTVLLISNHMLVHPQHVHPLKLVVILEEDNGDVVHIQVLIVVLIMLIVVQMGTNVILSKVNV